jgi:hypothetical protein
MSKVTQLKYGMRISICANPRERNGASFKRWSKGVEEEYQVIWVSHGGDRVEARRGRHNGKLDPHYYTFYSDEILPSFVLNLKMEDLL